MTNSILDSYATRIEAQIDPENLLGRLFWYAMSEMRVPHADFVGMLTDVGITTGHPLEPKDADVFRRECSKVKRVKVATNDDDVFENYRMVEFRDDHTITRRVVRERVNNAGRKLGFTELFDVVFDRDTADLVFKSLKDFRFRNNSTPADIRDEILDQYYMWRGCLNAYAIREWIRNFIMHLGATMVRPGGGVYFLREAHETSIENLETIGVELSEYSQGKVEFHSLPLIDDTKQREMVQRAFEAETVDAIDELIGEITDLSRAKKKITSDRYAGLVDKFQDLTSRTQEYEELLEQKLASTSTRLDIFQRSLLNLRKQIKE